MMWHTMKNSGSDTHNQWQWYNPTPCGTHASTSRIWLWAGASVHAHQIRTINATAYCRCSRHQTGIITTDDQLELIRRALGMVSFVGLDVCKWNRWDMFLHDWIWRDKRELNQRGPRVARDINELIRCLKTWRTDLPHIVEEYLDVNGDAMLASPRRTTCAFSSSSIFFKICATFFYCEDAKTVVTTKVQILHQVSRWNDNQATGRQ